MSYMLRSFPNMTFPSTQRLSLPLSLLSQPFSVSFSSQPHPPLPPFTKETAIQKVRMAEDVWNSKDPHKVKLAYSPDTIWRNRSFFLHGRDQVAQFLHEKWLLELDYKLIKELWAFTDDRIAVRFCYEYQNVQSGLWFRAYGNENWKFNQQGLMTHRHASINDVPIQEDDRLFLWQQPIRPQDHPALSDLGL